MLRLSHILTTAALVAVCAAPASAATSEQFRSSYQPAPPSQTGHGQDLRSPDAVDAAQHRGLYASDRDGYVLNRDYGSPDAADAAPQPADRDAYALNRDYGSPDAVDAASQPAARDSYALNRDYGSPDAVDAARDLPPVQIPVVAHDGPSGGFDWGDAGIGAAGMLGIFSIAAGSALLLTGRRRRHGIA